MSIFVHAQGKKNRSPSRSQPDWTPNFANQALPDWTETRLLFYLPSTGYQFSQNKVSGHKFWVKSKQTKKNL